MATRTVQHHHPDAVVPYVLVVTKVLPYVLVVSMLGACGLGRLWAALPVA
jgi:hypothetical protein